MIKGGSHLEHARLLKTVALNKTGTLTLDKPSLVEACVWGAGDEVQLKRLAASLAGRSDHPVARAIAVGSRLEASEIDDFMALPGLGVRGRVNGVNLQLGNHRLMQESGLGSPDLDAALAMHESQGRSITLLADATRVPSFFAVADTVKSGALQAVDDLRSLGVVSVMLTGDSCRAAQAIATQADIEDARGNLLPEANLQAIRQLQQRYDPTGMIGDGINDASALAHSDPGFAMGAAGTGTAIEAADVVIMNHDLQRVAQTIRLFRRTHAVLWQNTILALGIKTVFLPLAVFGMSTMWMVVFADMAPACWW